MQRGSLVAGVLSLLGAAIAVALVAVTGDVVSMYTAIGAVLLLNAAIRFKLAASGRGRDARR